MVLVYGWSWYLVYGHVSPYDSIGGILVVDECNGVVVLMVAAVVVVVEDEQEVDYEVWPSVAVPVVELEVGSEYSVASSFLLVATHYTRVNN